MSQGKRLQKNIALLRMCLRHQQQRLDRARQQAHQATIVLQNQRQQLKGLEAALNDYRLPLASSGTPLAMINQNGFRHLLIDVRDIQQQEVEQKQRTVERCQAEVLKEQAKIKAMETALTRLQTRQMLQLSQQEQRLLDELVNRQSHQRGLSSES